MDEEIVAKIAAEIHWIGRFMEGDKYAIARRILAIPEIREALELSEKYYLHDGPGGVHVVLKP